MDARVQTFDAGDGEAVLIPDGMGFGVGALLTIERRGDEIVLRRETEPLAPAEVRAKLAALADELRRIGPPPGGREAREAPELPERPRL